MIKKLMAHGCVESKTNEEDKRSCIVYLTEKGKSLEKGFFHISEKIFEIEYEGIANEDRIIYERVFAKVHENFKKFK